MPHEAGLAAPRYTDSLFILLSFVAPSDFRPTIPFAHVPVGTRVAR